MPDDTRKVEIQFKLLDDFSGALGKIVSEIRKTTDAARTQETGITRLKTAFRNFGTAVRSAVITPLRNVATAFRTVSRAIFNVRTAFAGIIAGLAVRRAISAFFDTAKALDEIAESAKKVGLAASDLQAFRFIAEQVGTDVGALGSGLRIASKNISAFVRSGGQGELAASFKRLGVEAADLQDPDGSLKSMADIIPLLADEFANLTDEVERTALAQLIFGRGGAELIPLLELGGDRLRQLRREQELLVGANLDKQAAVASDLEDAIVRVRQAFFGLRAAIVEALAPAVTEFFNELAAGVAGARVAFEELSKNPAAFRAALIEAGAVAVRTAANIGVAVATAFVEAIGQTLKVIGGNVFDSIFVFDAATAARTRKNLEDQLSSIRDQIKGFDRDLEAFKQRRLQVGGGPLIGRAIDLQAPDIERLKAKEKELQDEITRIDALANETRKKQAERAQEASRQVVETTLAAFDLVQQDTEDSILSFLESLGPKVFAKAKTAFDEIIAAFKAGKAQAAQAGEEISSAFLAPIISGFQEAKRLAAAAPVFREFAARRAELAGDDAAAQRLELENKQLKEREELLGRIAAIQEPTRGALIAELQQIHAAEAARLDTQLRLAAALKTVTEAENEYEDSLRDVDALLKQGSISEAEAKRQTSLRAEALRDAAEAAKVAIAALRQEAGGMGLKEELDAAIRKMDALVARTEDAEPIVRNFFQAITQGVRQFSQGLGQTLAGVQGLITDQLGNLRGGLGDVFSGIIRGTKNLSDAWTAMLDRMIDTLGNFLADQVLREFLGLLGFDQQQTLLGLGRQAIAGGGGGGVAAATPVAAGATAGVASAAAEGISDEIGADIAKTAVSTTATETAVTTGSKGIIGAVFDGAKIVVNALDSVVEGLITGLTTGLVAILGGGALLSGAGSLFGAASGIIGGIGSALGTILSPLLDTFKIIGSGIAGLLGPVGGAVGGALAPAAGLAAGAVQAVGTSGALGPAGLLLLPLKAIQSGVGALLSPAQEGAGFLSSALGFLGTIGEGVVSIFTFLLGPIIAGISAIGSAIVALFTLTATTAAIPFFGAEGGEVPGPRGAGDIVPAMLTPGERVLTVRENQSLKRLMSFLMQSLGQPPRDIMAGLASLRRVSLHAGPYFQQGGTVAAGRQQAPQIVPVPIVANEQTARQISSGGRYEWLRFIREHSAEINLALKSAGQSR